MGHDYPGVLKSDSNFGDSTRGFDLSIRGLDVRAHEALITQDTYVNTKIGQEKIIQAVSSWFLHAS